MQSAILTKFKNFRDQIFSCFTFRADATMNLVDALSGNQDASSVVQLSLNPAFKREYGSVRDAITNFSADPIQRTRIENCLINHCSPTTETQPYRLLVIDCTAAPRKYSKTLSDRGMVHTPNVIPGNKPVTVGHQYSIVGFLPEQTIENQAMHPWMLPLSTRRVATNTNGIKVGLEQLKTIIPVIQKDTAVIVGDTAYSSPNFIQGIQQYENTILIARLKSNRILNRKPNPKKKKVTNRRERGHELWYGPVFNLQDQSTWSIPDESTSEVFQSRKGKILIVKIEGWDDFLMHQKNGIPMNKYPFRIIRITITDENNNPIYKRPMWLMVSGKRRRGLSLVDIWHAYKRRYDIEHFFKFGKTRLLMDKFQTPDTTHEESWWQISSLGYAQLYMARTLAHNLPNPWEKYLPEMKKDATVKSARQVQKSFIRITAEIGTPASTPKPRVKPPGRKKGAKQPKRYRHPLVLKRPKISKKKAA